MYNIYKSIFINSDSKFIKEEFNGNIEYKLRLDTKTNESKQKFITQMIWRLQEGYDNTGFYDGYYLLGVYDSGNIGNLTITEIQNNIDIFKSLISTTDIKIKDDIIKNINDSYIYFCNIYKENNIKIDEYNVCVIGEQQSGKTTLISNICYDEDMKNQILKHSHEKLNGITTDIKKEIIGIKNNNIINYIDYLGWDDIALNSDTIINIYDIPMINFKNVITYLLGIEPDTIFIISKNKEHTKEIKFYIEFCKYYKINYILFHNDDIKVYNKKVFTNIFNNIITIEKKSTFLNDNALFRIIDYYDIPERGQIVSGTQISNKFNINDNCYLLYISCLNKQIYYDINIKSIHKKNINFSSLNKGESGSINFYSKEKIKLNKNLCIVSNKLNMIKQINFDCDDNTLLDHFINNESHLITLYCGNIVIKTEININDNNIMNFIDPIILTDTKFIIELNNCYYLCKLKNIY